MAKRRGSRLCKSYDLKMKQVRSWLIGDYKRIPNGSTFIPLYNGIEDSYVIDSIGYWCVIGVLERTTTLAGATKFLRVVLKFLNKRLRYNQKEFF